MTTSQPIIEEEDEEDVTKEYPQVTKSIDEEIDSIIHHYAGNAIDNVSKLKQKDIISAQKRAKMRLKENKKREELTKDKSQKKKRQEKVKKKKELQRKRKREIQTMHQKKRKKETSQNNNSAAIDRLHTTAGISYSEECLGHTEPDRKLSDDLDSQEAILHLENTSNEIDSSDNRIEETSNKYSSREATNDGILQHLK